MPHRALAIANQFLDLAERGGKTISPMKLQKLIFFAHGWNLALRDEPLLLEQIEAWDYGPVIPVVYHQFKKFGRGPISGRGQKLEIVDLTTEPLGIKLSEYKLDADPDTQALLERIWEVYGEVSAIQLSNATHQSGGAWFKTYHEGGGRERRGTDIPDVLIKDEFLAKASRSQQAST